MSTEVHIPILISKSNHFFIIGVFTDIDEAHKVGLRFEYEHNLSSGALNGNKFTAREYTEIYNKLEKLTKINQSFLKEWLNIRDNVDINYKFAIDSKELNKKLERVYLEENSCSENEEYAIIDDFDEDI